MFNNLNYGFHSTELGRHNNVWNENCFCNVLNCGVGDDKIQNILWQLIISLRGIKGFPVTWWLQLINKSILYKRCQRNLIWNCVHFSFSYVNQGTNCFFKSGTFILKFIWKKRGTQNYLNLYAKALRFSIMLEISSMIN